MTEQAWTTTITRIDPIPNKDRIVLATVEGYQSIVAKDAYQVGDLVCYISEQTLVPLVLQQELGLEGRLAGSHKDRVKAIKMGGALSQGIVCRPLQWKFWQSQVDSGQNVAPLDDVLGVSRYQPSIPVHLSGKVMRPKGDAPICAMYDVENIKKQVHFETDTETWWDPFDGKLVCVTEKLHGTNIGIHMNANDLDTIYVFSKGLGQNGHVLIEDENNTYWRAFRKYPGIEQYMRNVLKHEQSVTVYGEVVGRGIQDMNYGIQDVELFVFDVRIWNQRDGAMHISAHELYASAHELYANDFQTVPVLHVGLYSRDMCEQLAKEPSILDGGLREGVVVVAPGHDYKMNGQRNIAKFINPEYLLRKSGTEFQ